MTKTIQTWIFHTATSRFEALQGSVESMVKVVSRKGCPTGCKRVIGIHLEVFQAASRIPAAKGEF